MKNGNGDNLPGEQADGPVPAARANRCPRAATARWSGAEPRTRKGAGMAASCRAYQSGSSVVALQACPALVVRFQAAETSRHPA